MSAQLWFAPVFASFRDAESFYATLAHESTHWTKHPTRLERDFGRKSWGDAGYGWLTEQFLRPRMFAAATLTEEVDVSARSAAA